MRRTFGNLFSFRSSQTKTTTRQRKPLNRLRRALSLSILEDRSVPATYTVTLATDTGVAGELRDAVNQANALAGADNIVFAGGLAAQTITLNGTEIAVTDGVTITGFTKSPGVPNLTIDAATLSRAFNLNNTSAVVTFAFSGLNFINGNGVN